MKKILVAWDFCTPAEKIAAWAGSLARRFEAAICVVAVAPDMTALSNFFPPHTRFQEKVVCKTERQLHSFLAEHFQEMPVVEVKVLVGNEADAIIQAAQDEQVDLILMGTFGRSGLNRLLLGSVTEKLVEKTPCPVLVIGPEVKQLMVNALE